jgi:glyoxylase-like metal-dependent hydrolase (beta-lactamase superfamily II)
LRLPKRKPNALGNPSAGNRVDIAPAHDEIEVSLFGPGYGESIVLHLGENAWFIVDSCIDPAKREPAPLTYLHRIQIDPATSVQQVIATHWHDDHIRGLGRIVQVCGSANFVCSAALRDKEFLTLVTAYGQRAMMTSPGVREFYEVIQALDARRQRQYPSSLIFATTGRCLWRRDVSIAGARNGAGH